MRECSDDVLLGMTRLSSSRLAGRDALDRGLEVKEGGMVVVEEKEGEESPFRFAGR